METISDIKNLAINSLNQIAYSISETAPKVLFAILIIFIGWFVTKIITFLLKRTLKFSKVDRFTEIINDKNLFGTTDLKFNVSSVIIGFTKWLLFLVFLIIASDVMEWEIVSLEIGKLLSYLPKLFSAIALFMIGLYIANFIKKAVLGLFESFDLQGGSLISSVVFYIIIVTITITAINQAGVNTDLITNNLTIILAGFLTTMVLGFGLGSKDVINNLLLSFYSKRNFEIDQFITIDDISGKIIAIDNICIIVEIENGDEIVIPIKEVVNSRVTKKKM